MTKYEEITKLLEEFYKTSDELRALMVVEKDISGVIVIPKGFASEVSYVWDELERALKIETDLIKNFHALNLSKIFFQLQEFQVMMYVVELEVVLIIITDTIGYKEEFSIMRERIEKELIPNLNNTLST